MHMMSFGVFETASSDKAIAVGDKEMATASKARATGGNQTSACWRRQLGLRMIAVAVVAVLAIAFVGGPFSWALAAAEVGSTAFSLGRDASDPGLVWADQLAFRVLGSEFARIELELFRTPEGFAQLIDRAYYDSQATKVVTQWEFDDSTAPLLPQRYAFSVVTPGGSLDAAISWGDATTYEIAQTGSKGEFSLRSADPNRAAGGGSRLLAVPLDNNALADYLVATWLLTSAEPGERGEFGLVLPASLTQHQMVIDSVVEYLGTDSSLGRQSLKYSVSVGGVNVHIWTTPGERRLLKLEIPSQGVLIANDTLLAEWAEDLEVDGTPPGPSASSGAAADAATSSASSAGADSESLGDQKPATTDNKVTEIDVEVPVLGGTVSATLSLLTDVAGQVPGVVIVAGSGPTDRDGNNPLIPGQVNTYREIAHYLSARGIAVLRYDKRGIAGSAGLALTGTPPFDWFADDAASCVEYLKSVEMVDPSRVYIAGHSEGGVLALMAALSESDLAGLVLLSSPGYPMHYTLWTQMEAQGAALESMGLVGIKDKILTALDDLYTAIRTRQPFDLASHGLPEGFADVYLSLDLQREFAEGWLEADPAEMASQLEIPMCIIQGTADTQVTADNADVLVAAYQGPVIEVHIIDGADHVLKPTHGEPLAYGDPSRRVSPEVLEAIEAFVNR